MTNKVLHILGLVTFHLRLSCIHILNTFYFIYDKIGFTVSQMKESDSGSEVQKYLQLDLIDNECLYIMLLLWGH